MNPLSDSAFRFIRRWAIFSVAGIVGAVALNGFMDPYAIYGTKTIRGINAVKTEFGPRVYLAKAHLVARLKPQAIILGTSRAEIGLSPEHPGWDPSAIPRYNLGLAGVNIYEAMRYFQRAHASQPLKQVVLAMDFFMFNLDYANEPGFEESRLAGGDLKASSHEIFDAVSTLCSLDALDSSLRTLRLQKSNDLELYLPNGQRDYSDRPAYIRRRGGQHAVFLKAEEECLNKLWFSAPWYRFRLEDESGPNQDGSAFNARRSTFDAYQTILRTAYRDKIDLRMLINPEHARLLEALRASGLWPLFEEWKRKLAEVNREEAVRAHSKSFPLWDFNTCSAYAMEEIPPLGDKGAPMKWFWEGAHYHKELGDIMLDRVFHRQNTQHPTPDDHWGVILSEENIESHLASVQEALEHYRATHPSDIAEVDKLAEEAASFRKKVK